METPTLILVHGYPLDHTMWDLVVQQLGSKVRVLTPDLPGFGGTPAETREPSIDLMADSIEQMLRLHHLSSAVIAGMSMGGYVALSFAERHRKRVAALGLISTQTAADSEDVRRTRRELITKVRASGIGAATQGLIPKFFSSTNPPGPALIRYPEQGAEKAGVDGICWALEAMARRPDRTGLLRTFDAPALVVHGSDDQLVPVERARAAAALLVHGTYLEIPNGGHATPLEAPAAVAAALMELVRCATALPGGAVRPTARRNKSDRPGIVWGPTEQGL